MGSDVLSRPASGVMIVAYLATSFVTVILAIGSLGLDRNADNQFCKSTTPCSSFLYALPAIATPFSIITLILALLLTRLYHIRAISGIIICISNTFAATIWLIVIAIGWSPIKASYDASSRTNSLGITGWFFWVRDVHNRYETPISGRPVYNEWQPLDVGSSLDQHGSDTINFSFGLLVMIHIIFVLSIVMAVIGLMVQLKGASDGESISKRAASRIGNTNKGPWVHPHALADKKADEPMSSV